MSLFEVPHRGMECCHKLYQVMHSAMLWDI